MSILCFSFWYYNNKILLAIAVRLAGLWGFKECAYSYNWGQPGREDSRTVLSNMGAPCG